MVGSDARDSARAIYNLTSTDYSSDSGSGWIVVQQPSGLIATSTSDSWSVALNLKLSTSGLRERASPYTCELSFHVEARADPDYTTLLHLPYLAHHLTEDLSISSSC